MSDGTGTNPDPRSEVESVLAGAVGGFGAAVLSNATLLEGICEDQLAEYPREASLVSAAAHFGVAHLLAQQIQGVGPDDAVRLTAAELSDARSLDPGASLWVVGEFARALGHQVTEGLAPLPSAAAPVSPDAPGTGTPGTAAGGLLPPTPAAPSGPAETVLPPGPSAGGGAPIAGQPSARPRSGRPPVLWVVLAVVIAAGGYLGTAAGTHLPPFSKAKATHGSSANGPLPSSYGTLEGLIPQAISGGGTNCTTQNPPHFGAVAEVLCQPGSGAPVDQIDYYLYGSQSSLTNAYADYLGQFANVTEGAGDCSSFAKFSPGCETEYGPGSATAGHIVEYQFKGKADISFTVNQNLLLIDTWGSSGDSIVAWWSQIPAPWISSGSST